MTSGQLSLARTNLHQHDGAASVRPLRTKQGATAIRVHVYALAQQTVFTFTIYHAHAQCSALPPGENKHLIKQFRCASAEVDYMYLAQIIISGSHVHYNYRQHLCLAHLQSLPWMPSSNLAIIISTGGKRKPSAAVQLNNFTIKNAAVFSSWGEKHCLNRIPGIMNYQKPLHENI